MKKLKINAFLIREQDFQRATRKIIRREHKGMEGVIRATDVENLKGTSVA